MNEITNYERAFQFAGRGVSTILIDEEPHWLVTEIEEVLGYAPKSLTPLIRREWADELQEGADYLLVSGEQLKTVKELVVSTTTSFKHAKSIMLLSEQGVYAVALLSRKPAGRALRRWLSAEVLPSIRKTGKYQLDEHAIKLIGVRKREALKLLTQAAEADIISKTYLERFTLQGAAVLEGKEVEGPHLLDVSSFLESKGVPHSQIESKRPWFGRKMTAAYVRRHDRRPGKARRFVNGGERTVNCYTEEDLDLFEAVYDEMFGE